MISWLKVDRKVLQVKDKLSRLKKKKKKSRDFQQCTFDEQRVRRSAQSGVTLLLSDTWLSIKQTWDDSRNLIEKHLWGKILPFCPRRTFKSACAVTEVNLFAWCSCFHLLHNVASWIGGYFVCCSDTAKSAGHGCPRIWPKGNVPLVPPLKWRAHSSGCGLLGWHVTSKDDFLKHVFHAESNNLLRRTLECSF